MINLDNSLPYILLVIFYLLIGLIWSIADEQNKYNLKIIGVLVYLFFFGFRGFIGFDWTTYYPLYGRVPLLFGGQFFKFLSHTLYEPGYVVFISLTKYIYVNYTFFVFIHVFIDIILITTFFNRYKINFGFGLALFLCIGGYTLQIDLMRNILSILLFLLSLKYISNRKIMPYFLINIIGFLIHSSAILFLPLYFFFHKAPSKVLFITIIVIGNILFLTQIQYIKPILIFLSNIISGRISTMISAYLSLTKNSYGISIGYIERLITSVLIIIYYNKLISNNSNNILFINAYMVYFIMFFYFSELDVISIRLGILFVFSYWILWPQLYECIELKTNKMLFISILFVYCLLRTNNYASSILYRYDNVLTGSRNYYERCITFIRYVTNVD